VQPNNGLIFDVLRAGEPLTTNQKMVLLVLLNHWNPKNFGAVVWPGQARIAAHARLSKRATFNALTGLERLGLIKITHESGRSNRYNIIADPIRALTPARDAGVSSEPVHEVPGTHAPRAGDPCTSCRRMPCECLTDALRHSEKQPDRQMAHVGVVAGTAMNALREKKS